MLEIYKHIIWDWNGTLFDDVELCLDIINNILIKRNLNALSLDDYRNIFTFPVKDYYAEAGLDFNKYPFEELGQEWMNEYENRKTESKLHEGTEEVLKHLNNKKIGQSILSAYKQHPLEQIVKKFNLNNYFSNMVGLDHIYATSKIELGKNLMQKLGNGKDETLLIGDTVHDFEVAREISADCLLIANGHQSKERLATCGVPVLNSLAELLTL